MNSSRVSGPRLFKQRFRHRDLADVVEQARRCGSARLPRSSIPRCRANAQREIADALRVTARVGVLRLERQRERADHVLALLEVGVVVLDAQQRADARRSARAG